MSECTQPREPIDAETSMARDQQCSDSAAAHGPDKCPGRCRIRMRVVPVVLLFFAWNMAKDEAGGANLPCWIVVDGLSGEIL